MIFYFIYKLAPSVKRQPSFAKDVPFNEKARQLSASLVHPVKLSHASSATANPLSLMMQFLQCFMLQ